MPIYEYQCEDHGVFEVLKPLHAYGAPERCPTCEGPGARILSSPNVACVPRAERVARDRNERASHEPRLAKKNRGQAHGHAHGHAHAHKHAAPAPGGGLRAYKGKRPWVMEHG